MGERIMTLEPEHLLAILGCLSGAISLLWASVSKSSKRTHERLKQSEDNVERHTASLVELNRTVGLLEGRQEGVESLARDVLDVVHRETRNNRQ